MILQILKNELVYQSSKMVDSFHDLPWYGNQGDLINEKNKIKDVLAALDKPVWAVQLDDTPFLTSQNGFTSPENLAIIKGKRLAYVAAMPIETLGDPAFKQTYGTRFAYFGGAMANAIASVDMVIAMGRAGMMCSFGSAGVSPNRVEDAIQKIQLALPDGPYAINLIHSPNEPSLERLLVEMYLKYKLKPPPIWI